VTPGQPVEATPNAYPDWKIPGEVIAIITQGVSGTGTARPGGPWATWDLPDGTALAQTLTLPPHDGKPARRLETRVLLKQANDWSAYSYLWNDAQDDAVLVPKEGGGVNPPGFFWLPQIRRSRSFRSVSSGGLAAPFSRGGGPGGQGA